MEIKNKNPGQTINRHYFLAMETPLRLITRGLIPYWWDDIILTTAGQQLATGFNSVALFEELLKDIRFCQEPWYSAAKHAKYPGFDVHPYPAILAMMQDNSGYIDRDEFDLFASRVRTQPEVPGASKAIAEFRSLTEKQKTELRKEVENRTDGRKSYDNWRDMAHHAFSLFSLGGERVPRGQRTVACEDPCFHSSEKAIGSGRRQERIFIGCIGACDEGCTAQSEAPSLRTVLLLPNVSAPDDL